MASSTANVTLTTEDESIQYELKISQGSMTDEEKGNLTENMKKACSNKQIEKIKVQATTKDDFEKMANGEIVEVKSDQLGSRNKRSGCSEIKVIK